MVREIKTSLMLDGEKAFKTAMNDMARNQRVLASEMKATTAAFDGNENSMDSLTAKSRILKEQVSQQKAVVAALAGAVKDATVKYGDSSSITDGYRIKLNGAQAALSKMEGELGDVTGKLNTFGAEMQQETVKAGSLNTVLGKVGAGLKAMGSATLKAAVVGIGAAAAGVAAGLTKSVVTAADFEQELSNIQAVSGATTEEMQKLHDAALQAGADTAYSASEAALGMEELLKAGLSTEQVLNGGLNGALTLAAAGGLELGDAAEIASTALNAFRSDNLTVADAANVLAGAANASATSVQELKSGLSQSAAVASGMGMSFQDTSTALAVFAQNGLKGSDAGTSLKTMLMNLQPATDKQAKQFEELGLLTKDGTSKFYDASGSLRSLDEIAGLLQTSMKGLTDAERAMALETIFGSDAVRAGNILFKEGAKGVEDMAAAMGKVSAAEVAAKRLDNFKGAVESLKGSVETIAIKIGEQLLPGLTDMTQELTAALNAGDWQGIGKIVEKAVQFAADNVTKAVPTILNIAVSLLTSLATALVESIPTVLPALMASVVALLNAITGIIAEQGPMLITTAINAVGTLIQGLLQAMPQLAEAAIQMVLALVNGISAQLPTLIPAAVDAVTTVVQTLADNLPALIDAALKLILALVDGIIAALPKLIEAAPRIVSSVIDGIVQALPKLIDAAVSLVTSLITYLVQNMPLLIDTSLKLVTALATGLIQAVPELAMSIPTLIGAIIDTFTATDWGSTGKSIIDGIAKGIRNGIDAIKEAARNAAQAALNAAKKLLGINSPSRVMEQQVGMQMGAGMANGIRNSAVMVNQAMSGLSGQLVGNAKLNLSAKAIGTAAATASQGAVITINFNGSIRSKDDIRQVAMLLQRGMEGRSRAMGVATT